jgi:hypothetical protein
MGEGEGREVERGKRSTGERRHPRGSLAASDNLHHPGAEILEDLSHAAHRTCLGVRRASLGRATPRPLPSLLFSPSQWQRHRSKLPRAGACASPCAHARRPACRSSSSAAAASPAPPHASRDHVGAAKSPARSVRRIRGGEGGGGGGGAAGRVLGVRRGRRGNPGARKRSDPPRARPSATEERSPGSSTRGESGGNERAKGRARWPHRRAARVGRAASALRVAQGTVGKQRRE